MSLAINMHHPSATPPMTAPKASVPANRRLHARGMAPTTRAAPDSSGEHGPPLAVRRSPPWAAAGAWHARRASIGVARQPHCRPSAYADANLGGRGSTPSAPAHPSGSRPAAAPPLGVCRPPTWAAAGARQARPRIHRGRAPAARAATVRGHRVRVTTRAGHVARREPQAGQCTCALRRRAHVNGASGL
jgi:hypothetical protein